MIELKLCLFPFRIEEKKSSSLFSIWMIKQMNCFSSQWTNTNSRERKKDERGLKIIRSHDIELYKSNYRFFWFMDRINCMNYCFLACQMIMSKRNLFFFLILNWTRSDIRWYSVNSNEFLSSIIQCEGERLFSLVLSSLIGNMFPW